MSSYSISALKTSQDKFDARKDKLLQSFIPFRDGLLERLERFTKEALENDLRDVKLCERRKDTNEILEVTLALNGFNIVLVATDHVALLENPPNALASKILIYPEGNEDAKPYAEIVVHEYRKELYAYYIRSFPHQGPRLITHTSDVNEGAGQKAAEALISHFYGLRRLWPEEGPTLRVMLSGEVKKRGLGFQLKQE